jgi:hypothetical protein
MNFYYIELCDVQNNCSLWNVHHDKRIRRDYSFVWKEIIFYFFPLLLLAVLVI